LKYKKSNLTHIQTKHNSVLHIYTQNKHINCIFFLEKANEVYIMSRDPLHFLHLER